METASSILTIKEVAQSPCRARAHPQRDLVGKISAECSPLFDRSSYCSPLSGKSGPPSVLSGRCQAGLRLHVASQAGGPCGGVPESSSWLYAGIGLVAVDCCMWKPPKISLRN